MKLQKLIACLQYAVIQSPGPVTEMEVRDVVYHSRKAVEGSLFVCLKGTSDDGHAHIEEACAQGACFVMVEKMVFHGKMLHFPENTTVLLVKDTREALAYVSAAWFHYPATKLKIIGVTGTKGKTTVTTMIHRILAGTGHKAGLIGTIENIVGEEQISSINTTPESFTIHEYFAKMVEAGCEYAVMEVSSQGIKQKRIEGIEFAVGVFTNFGEDHIGPREHASLGEYRYYKSLLFRQCKVGIGNLDDIQCRYMFRRTSCRKYGYTCRGGKEGASHILQAERIHFLMEEDGPRTWFEIKGCRYSLEMPGMFNVYNALAALQTAECLGIELCLAAKVLAGVQVRGRTERICTGEKIACYIDYAHNAMSLQNVLAMFRIYNPHRIILVFGCGGNRAKSRRTQMGETAGRLADYTIITSDNPRFEKPEQIIADIVEGMKETAGQYEVIPDRQEAVEKALENAREGDVVLIAGKGHETYQEIEGIRYPMDDRRLAEDAFNNLQKGQRTCTQTLL